MKAKIQRDGTLYIIAENETDDFALKSWFERHNINNDVTYGARQCYDPAAQWYESDLPGEQK